MIKSRYDDAVFYWMCEGTFHGIVSCHVDDFIWGGTVNFEVNVIQLIKSKFQISKSEGETFNYLGLTVSQESIGIKISQKIYIDKLKDVFIAKERKLQKLNRLNDMEAQQLRSIAGQLNWVSGQSRPDLSFGDCEVSVSIKNGNIGDLITANKYIRKLKDEDVEISIPCLGDLKNTNIICFSDASLEIYVMELLKVDILYFC